MLLDILSSVLTFVTGPPKRASLTLQTVQILNNRHKLSTPVLLSMPAVQEPPTSQTPVAIKDTGFPEPLSPDRNTTLCHPDANTSPNATIEGPDIALERRHSRRSFHRRGKNKSFSGKITLEERMMYDHENASIASALSPTVSASRIAEKIESVNGEAKSEDGDSGVFINKEEKSEQSSREGEKKKGILQKLHLHND